MGITFSRQRMWPIDIFYTFLLCGLAIPPMCRQCSAMETGGATILLCRKGWLEVATLLCSFWTRHSYFLNIGHVGLCLAVKQACR
jgi:hypothetical protein